MPNLKPILTLTWQTLLTDPVTALGWSPTGTHLAVASAAGEVVLFETKTGISIELQPPQGYATDVLAFSAGGRFLAAGGQAGLLIWHLAKASAPRLLTTLEHPRVWVDTLQWHPQRPELALGLGRCAQVWDAAAQQVVTTLDLGASSVLDLAWHPSGNALVLAGNQGIKSWQRKNWDSDPEVRETGGASESIALSPDGRYLAAGNNDRTLLVWAWDNPNPWLMRGLPGKVRQLAWSTAQGKVPLLASSSAEGVVVWTKAPSDDQGWTPQVLDQHKATVTALAFHPRSRLLASASKDGWVCLWHKAAQIAQILEGAASGFSSLAWSPRGNYLGTGGCRGEVMVWVRTLAGRRFS